MTSPAGHDNLGSLLSQTSDSFLANASVRASDHGHLASQVNIRELPVRLPSLAPVPHSLQGPAGEVTCLLLLWHSEGSYLSVYLTVTTIVSGWCGDYKRYRYHGQYIT